MVGVTWFWCWLAFSLLSCGIVFVDGLWMVVLLLFDVVVVGWDWFSGWVVLACLCLAVVDDSI